MNPLNSFDFSQVSECERFLDDIPTDIDQLNKYFLQHASLNGPTVLEELMSKLAQIAATLNKAEEIPQAFSAFMAYIRTQVMQPLFNEFCLPANKKPNGLALLLEKALRLTNDKLSKPSEIIFEEILHALKTSTRDDQWTLLLSKDPRTGGNTLQYLWRYFLKMEGSARKTTALVDFFENILFPMTTDLHVPKAAEFFRSLNTLDLSIVQMLMMNSSIFRLYIFTPRERKLNGVMTSITDFNFYFSPRITLETMGQWIDVLSKLKLEHPQEFKTILKHLFEKPLPMSSAHALKLIIELSKINPEIAVDMLFMVASPKPKKGSYYDKVGSFLLCHDTITSVMNIDTRSLTMSTVAKLNSLKFQCMDEIIDCGICLRPFPEKLFDLLIDIYPFAQKTQQIKLVGILAANANFYSSKTDELSKILFKTKISDVLITHGTMADGPRYIEWDLATEPPHDSSARPLNADDIASSAFMQMRKYRDRQGVAIFKAAWKAYELKAYREGNGETVHGSIGEMLVGDPNTPWYKQTKARKAINKEIDRIAEAELIPDEDGKDINSLEAITMPYTVIYPQATVVSAPPIDTLLEDGRKISAEEAQATGLFVKARVVGSSSLESTVASAMSGVTLPVSRQVSTALASITSIPGATARPENLSSSATGITLAWPVAPQTLVVLGEAEADETSPEQRLPTLS